MLSFINNVAENSLSNWSTSFSHALVEKDSDAHSLDQYHYWHIQVFSTLLCQVSFFRSLIFLLRLLRLYCSELIMLWSWAVCSQTMKTAWESWLYFWIAKIASSSYWKCKLNVLLTSQFFVVKSLFFKAQFFFFIYWSFRIDCALNSSCMRSNDENSIKVMIVLLNHKDRE